MTTTHDTTYDTVKLDVPEGTQTVSITRSFAASPDKVFRAHTDPELFVKWSYVSNDGDDGHGFFDSVESRDGMVASGMEHGITEGYNKLDRLLAEG